MSTALDTALASAKERYDTKQVPDFGIKDNFSPSAIPSTTEQVSANNIDSALQAASQRYQARQNFIASGMPDDAVAPDVRDGLGKRAAKQFFNSLILRDVESARPHTATGQVVGAAGDMFNDPATQAAISGMDEAKGQGFLGRTWAGIKAAPKLWWGMTRGYYNKPSDGEMPLQEQGRIAGQMARKELGQGILGSEPVEQYVPAAENFKEKAVDVGAGLGAFLIRLAAAKKLVPPEVAASGALSNALAWELTNTDGIPGEGALMGAALQGLGHIRTVSAMAKTGKLVGESAMFAGLAHVQGAEIEDQIIAALVPVALAGIGGLKNKFRQRMQNVKDAKTLQAAMAGMRTDALGELGLKEGASEAQIRTAFNAKIKQYHPDVNPGTDPRYSQAAKEAYDFLRGRGKAFVNPFAAGKPKAKNTQAIKRLPDGKVPANDPILATLQEELGKPVDLPAAGKFPGKAAKKAGTVEFSQTGAQTPVKMGDLEMTKKAAAAEKSSPAPGEREGKFLKGVNELLGKEQSPESMEALKTHDSLTTSEEKQTPASEQQTVINDKKTDITSVSKLNIGYGDELQENQWLHGSREGAGKNIFKSGFTRGGLFVTKSWDNALNYADKGGIDSVFSVNLENAKLLDTTNIGDIKKVSSKLAERFDVSEDDIITELQNININDATGITEGEADDIFYDAGFDGITNGGDAKIINPDVIFKQKQPDNLQAEPDNLGEQLAGVPTFDRNNFKQLRAAAKKLGLAASGTKAAIASRIDDHLRENIQDTQKLAVKGQSKSLAPKPQQKPSTAAAALDNMPLDQLQKMAKVMKLDHRGAKAELIARIQNNAKPSTAAAALDNMPLDQLQKMAKVMKLDHRGAKAELIARIQNNAKPSTAAAKPAGEPKNELESVRELADDWKRRWDHDKIEYASASLKVIDEALLDGITDAGTATLARYLVTQVDPSFDSNTVLEFSNEVKQAGREIVEREGFLTGTGENENGRDGDQRFYITGKTVSYDQEGILKTAVGLYRGHDADTLVEEWYHRFFNRLGSEARSTYEDYHRQSGDSRSVSEHFAQEGRDWFFSRGLHKAAGKIKELFATARNTLRALIRRIRKLRGVRIPEKIQRLYDLAGQQELDTADAVNYQIRRMPQPLNAEYFQKYPPGILYNLARDLGLKPNGRPADIIARIVRNRDVRDLVKTADGRYEFGQITDEIARQIDQPAGDIVLQIGKHNMATDNGAGLVHIEYDHGLELRKNGYKDIGGFIEDVAGNYDEILRQDNGRLVLVKSNGKIKFAVVELQEQENFYSVVTAFLSTKLNKKLSGELVWSKNDEKNRLLRDHSRKRGAAAYSHADKGSSLPGDTHLGQRTPAGALEPKKTPQESNISIDPKSQIDKPDKTKISEDFQIRMIDEEIRQFAEKQKEAYSEGKIRTKTDLYERIRRFAQGAKTGYRIGQKELAELHYDLTKYMHNKVDPVTRRQLEVMIAKTRTPAEVTKAAEAVEKEVDSQQILKARGEAMERFKNAISATKLEKMRPEYQEKLTEILKEVAEKKITKNTRRRLEATVEHAKDNPELLEGDDAGNVAYNPAFESAYQQAVKILDIAEGKLLRDMDPTEIDDVTRAVQGLVHQHQLKNKLIVMGQVRDMVTQVDDALEALSTQKNDPEFKPDINDPASVADVKTPKRWLRAADKPENVAMFLGDKEDSVPHQVFYKNIYQGYRDTLDIQHQASDFVRQELKQRGIDLNPEILAKHSLPVAERNMKAKVAALKLKPMKTLRQQARDLGLKDSGGRSALAKRIARSQIMSNVKVALPKATLGKSRYRAGEVTLTRGELLTFELSCRDHETYKEMMNPDGMGVSLDRANEEFPIRLEPQDIITIRKAARSDAEIMAFADVYSSFLNGKLAEILNKKWVEAEGFEIAVRKDHWPRRRNLKAVQGVDRNPLEYVSEFQLNQMGIFLKRQGGPLPIMIGDAHEVFFAHVNKVANYCGYHLPLVTAHRMLENPRYRRALVHRMGKSYKAMLDDYLDAVSGLMQNKKQNIFTSVINRLTSKIYVAQLGYKPFVMAKQVVSYAYALDEIDYKYWKEGLLQAQAGAVGNIRGRNAEILEEMNKWSPVMRARYEGSGQMIMGPVQDTRPMETFFLGSQEKWYGPMHGISVLDRAAISGIWEAAKAEGNDKGLSGDKLMEYTARRTEQVVNRTQPTFEKANQSQIARDSSGSMIKWSLTMYSSQRNQLWAMQRRAVWRLKNELHTAKDGKARAKAWGKFTKTAVIVLAFGAMSMYGLDELRDWVYRGLKPRRRKYRKGIADHAWGVTHVIAGNVYGGDIATKKLESVFRKTWEYSDNPIDQAGTNLVRFSKNAVGLFDQSRINDIDNDTSGKLMKMADDLNRGIAPLLGIPSSGPISLGKGVFRAFDKSDKADYAQDMFFDAYESGNFAETKNAGRIYIWMKMDELTDDGLSKGKLKIARRQLEAKYDVERQMKNRLDDLAGTVLPEGGREKALDVMNHFNFSYGQAVDFYRSQLLIAGKKPDYIERKAERLEARLNGRETDETLGAMVKEYVSDATDADKRQRLRTVLKENNIDDKRARSLLVKQYQGSQRHTVVEALRRFNKNWE